MGKNEREEFGKVIWECSRTPILILSFSLFFSFLSWLVITMACQRGGPYIFLASVVVLFSVGEVRFLCRSVVFVREKVLVIQKNPAGIRERLEAFLQPQYLYISYEDIVGFSDDGGELYLGSVEVGGMVKLPVPLSYVSVRDKEVLMGYIDRLGRKNQEG